MKVNFILKGENNPTKIICRVKFDQKNDYSIAIKYRVDRKEWNPIKQKLRSISGKNGQIDHLIPV